MNKYPLYSVIIPTFNRCNLLAQAIDSVLIQQYPDIDIIVIDDGSQDDTRSMLAKSYPQVKYFYQDNKGPAAARNLGIRQAKGKIIGFLDSDDLWLEGKIQHELQLFKQYPQADALAGNSRSFVAGQLHTADIFQQRDVQFTSGQPRYFDWSFAIMTLGPVCDTSGMTFKASAFEGFYSPYFDESLRLNEDWDFEFRLFSLAKVLLYPRITSYARVFYDDTRHHYCAKGQQKTSQEQRNEWQQQRKILARYLSNPGWNQQTLLGFQQRCKQLEQLLDDTAKQKAQTT